MARVTRWRVRRLSGLTGLRVHPHTIPAATGWKGDAVVLTETVIIDAASGTLTQRYQVYRGANVVATGVAVFERE